MRVAWGQKIPRLSPKVQLVHRIDLGAKNREGPDHVSADCGDKSTTRQEQQDQCPDSLSVRIR